MKRLGRLAASLLLTLVSTIVFAQNPVISGKVNATSTENINGISVTIKGTKIGTTTDASGNYSIPVPSDIRFPLTLVFSGVGIVTNELTVASASSNNNISVVAGATMADEIVVSATRTQTRALESPVTIEKVGLNTIRTAPSANYYDIVGNMKGVDLVTSSLTFKTVTTRGFNGSGNTRFNQIMDGMDNQAPGLNFSVGSVIGLTELDVESMELLPGASSALYGPGGMNGTMLINGKNPFKYQGLSFQIKEGIMNTDGKYRPTSSYNNWSIRWAEKLSEKIAFKVTAEFIQAKDWLAVDQRNYIRPTAANGMTVGEIAPGTRSTDPNYNGANVYGDETTADIRPFLLGIGQQAPFLQPFVNSLVAGGPINVSRTGYTEGQVIDPNTVNVKLGGSFNYKINPNLELVIGGYWGTGNTVYTGSDRYSLLDLKMGQYKVELLSKNWMLRAYTTQENAGQSYNLTAASRIFNEKWKPTVTFAANGAPNPQPTDWLVQYSQAYLAGMLNGLSNINAHNGARAVADVGRPEPGTEQYNSIYYGVRSTPISKGGALFLDKSDLYSVEGQWNLTEYTKNIADILVGGNFRRYELNSQGTLFIDTSGPIGINEYGVYAQAARNIFGDKVRLTVSARYDKNENFEGRVTPRATAVIKVAKNSNIRLSYQTAYRFPSTQQQYIRLGVGGGETLIGGLPVFHQIYNFAGNPPYQLPLGTGTPKQATFAEFKPESVQSFELGYKGLVADDRLLIDAYGYIGEYTNFIVRTAVGQKRNTSLPPTPDNLATLSVPINSTGKVSTWGAGISLEYRIGKGYYVNFNGSTDVLDGVTDNLVAYFNSPRYRYNFIVGNNSLGKDKRIGVSATFRWQDSFSYESDFVSGVVPAYSTLDAQITYKFPAIKSLIGIGANNLLNQYYVTAMANPAIGGLYYVRFAYNIF